MTTSNSYSYNLNQSQIITSALEGLNIILPGATPTARDYNLASKWLNIMLKFWEGDDGIKLWKRRRGYLFLQPNQSSYQLGSVSGSDNVTNAYTNTTLSSSAAIAATSIVVTSATGFVATQYIGIQLDNGDMQWTTITSVVGTTINLTDALTDSATTPNIVITYASKINRPLQVIQMTTCDLLNNNNEVTVKPIGYDEYFNMPIKSSVGRPANFYYDRLLNNAVPYTGTLYLFNTPIVCTTILNFTYYDCIQDMLTATNTGDFPQEWLLPVIMNLQYWLCYPYKKFAEMPTYKDAAAQLLQTIQDFDSDDTPLTIGIDRSSPNGITNP